MKVRLLCMLVCLQLHVVTKPFLDTLDQARELANTLPEYPDVDTPNLIYPSYASFYQGQRIPLLERSKNFFIGPAVSWNFADFHNLLKQVVNMRMPYGCKGRCVEKIVSTNGQQIIVFTHLSGAYHSFVRMLTELENQKKLKSDFVLADSVNIVINGNVLTQGPYPLFTLALVLKLMMKNPHAVSYCRGRAENPADSAELVKNQLANLFGTMIAQKLFISTLQDFYLTLPVAIYLVDKNIGNQAVKIVSRLVDVPDDLDYQVGDFLSTTSSDFFYYLEDTQSVRSSVSIPAILNYDSITADVYSSHGLRAKELSDGTMMWYLISVPTRTQRTLDEFFYDAFVIIKTTKTVEDWKIVLYNRSVLGDAPFKAVEERGLVSKNFQERVDNRIEKTAGNETDEILIGTTLDLSGSLKNMGKLLRLGMNMAFDEVNNAGGIHGKKIRLFALDDGYRPERARANSETLLSKYGIDIILSPLGYSPMVGYLPFVQEGKILVLFPVSGAPEIHRADLKYMINFRPSYADIDTALIKFAEEQIKPKRMAFVYAGDESSLGVVDHIKAADIKVPYKEYTHKEEETDFSFIINELHNFNPDVIGSFSYASEEFIRQLGVDFISRRYVLLTESEEAIRQLLHDKGIVERVWVTENSPNPRASQLPLAQNFRSIMGNRLIDVYSFYGYIAARLLLEVLKKIKEPLTKEKIITFFENVKNYDFGGLELDFDPLRRQLNHYLWIDQGKPDWKMIDLRKIMNY